MIIEALYSVLARADLSMLSRGQSEPRTRQKLETNSCRLFADKMEDKTIYNFYLPLPFTSTAKTRWMVERIQKITDRYY